MKHLLKWVIPAGVLLLVGMWIGLNWENFPANEEVYIPQATKNKVKSDTAVKANETEQFATSSVMDSLVAEEVEPLDSMIAEVEEPSKSIPDELSTASIPDKLPAATSKPVVLLNNRNTGPEYTAKNNKNLTPSVKKVKQPIPVVQPAFESVAAPRKEIVLESYMAKKEIPVDNLVKVDGSYKPGASGKGVGEATFIVYNRSGKNLKKVNMEVQYLGKGNQLLDKMQMPVTNIEADGSVNVKLPANAVADRVVYKVLYISSSIGDFYYEPLPVYASAMR